MQETWAELEGYPNYIISDHGRIEHQRTRNLVKSRPNEQQVQMVTLIQDGEYYTRSVAKLVADTFLEVYQDSLVPFDTIIHLDGDRSNVDASNLDWRPRVVALEYHRQFKMDQFYTNHHKCVEVETGLIFEQPKDACLRYGLLFRDVVKSIIEEVPCWPYGQNFRDFEKHSINM